MAEEKLEYAPLFREKNFRIVVMCYGGFIVFLWLVRNIIFFIQNTVFNLFPDEVDVLQKVKTNVMVLREMWKTFIPYMPVIGLCFVLAGILMFFWSKFARFFIILPALANIVWFVFFAIYVKTTVIPSLTFTSAANATWVNVLYFAVLILGGLYVCIMPVITGQFIYINKYMKDRI
jgi:hypothetical protein